MSLSRRRRDWMLVARRAVALVLAWACIAPVADAQLFHRKPFDESDLIAGRAALEDGFYDLAQEHLEAYIDAVPDKDRKAVGVAYLSQALIGKGEMEAALELLDRRDKWAKEVETVAAFRYWKARARFDLGRHHQALGTLRNFDTTYAETPYAGRALLLRAEIFEAVGDYEAALDAHDTLYRSYPRADEAAANLLNWGELLTACDQAEDALDALFSLIGQYSDSGYAEMGLLQAGRIYTEAEEWDMAWAMLDSLASDPEANPRRRVQALFAMAGTERDRGNVDPALDALARILELNPDPAEQARAAIQQGRLLIDVDQPEEGLAKIQQAVLDLPSEAEAARTQLYYAETLQELALHDRAAREFQNYLEAFTVQDGRAQALMGKGWSLWELRRYSEAAATFDKAFAEADDPEVRADAHLKSADSHFADGHYQVAAAAYREFAEMFPGHAMEIQALFQQAEALARGGDMEAAQRVLQRFVDEDPDTLLSLNARMRQGLIQEEAGDWEAAIAAYDEVLESEPDAATAVRARHRRGVMAYRMGRFREAYVDFEAVFAAAAPGLVAEEACYMRGWSLYMLGRDEEAMEICRFFIETYPESTLAPHVMFWLGEYHWNHGQYAEAETQFLALAQSRPGGGLVDQAWFWAARSAAKISEYLRANEHLTDLVRLHPGSPRMPEARMLQGDVLSELGKFSGAILAFEEIIKNWPTSYLVDQAWGRKGDCQFTLGTEGTNGVPQQHRLEEALASYRTVFESTSAQPKLKLQARYKMGRCEEKRGNTDEAIEHYREVVYEYFAEWGAGTPLDPVWFTRAAFGAAGLMESAEDWLGATRIYRRVVDAGVPAAEEARKRIQRIRLENWFVY